MNEHMDAHENLALLAIEATDREVGEQLVSVLEEIIRRADDVALLLALAIAHAEERALRGEAPLADHLKSEAQ